MNRLTSREIDENGRVLAIQLRGMSVSDAKASLAHAGQIIEDESMTIAQNSGQIELHIGSNLLANGFNSFGKGLVGKGGAEVVQATEGSITLSTDDNNQSGVASFNGQVFCPELAASTMRAFDHSNLQPIDNYPSQERQEQIPVESESKPQQTE
jgi:hypothetical protein